MLNRGPRRNSLAGRSHDGVTIKSHRLDQRSCHRWRFYLNLRGFSARYGNLYDLRWRNIDLYFNDVAGWKQRDINGRHSIILDDKILTDLIFGGVINSPTRVAYLSNGNVTLNDGNITDVNALVAILALRGTSKVVFKPIAGAAGAGVYMLWFEDGSFLRTEFRSPMCASCSPLIRITWRSNSPISTNMPGGYTSEPQTRSGF
jgi:hypothetical protein